VTEPADRTITIVTGSTRSGTSLVMRLLDHAGLPPLCDAGSRGTSYELDDAARHHEGHWSFLDRAAGRAVKVPDWGVWSEPRELPHMRFVVMTRDPEEQARSQIKFMRWQGFNVRPGKATVRELAAPLRKDVPRIVERARGSGAPVLELPFERLLTEPETSIAALLALCSLETSRAPALARLVVPRWPSCYPTMLEEHLWRAGQGAPASEARA
jgi:hypothetical protein